MLKHQSVASLIFLRDAIHCSYPSLLACVIFPFCSSSMFPVVDGPFGAAHHTVPCYLYSYQLCFFVIISFSCKENSVMSSESNINL